MPSIQVKRVYEAPSEEDGLRVLVDRIWPRGLSKKDAAIDVWRKDLAPSTELRKWFAHDPARWKEFQVKYRAELANRISGLRQLLEECGDRPLTLLFAAKDVSHNQAIVLRDVLEDMMDAR